MMIFRPGLREHGWRYIQQLLLRRSSMCVRDSDIVTDNRDNREDKSHWYVRITQWQGFTLQNKTISSQETSTYVSYTYLLDECHQRFRVVMQQRYSLCSKNKLVFHSFFQNDLRLIMHGKSLAFAEELHTMITLKQPAFCPWLTSLARQLAGWWNMAAELLSKILREHGQPSC